MGYSDIHGAAFCLNPGTVGFEFDGNSNHGEVVKGLRVRCAKVYLHDTEYLGLVDTCLEEYESWADKDGELGEKDMKRLKTKLKHHLWYIFASATLCHFHLTLMFSFSCFRFLRVG